jgi:hypothetical protein
MKQDDQRIVSKFVRVRKPDIDMSEFDAGYQLHYECFGQVNSGQNNPAIKKKNLKNIY